MGLDIVELILAVEEAFQIHISDEDAGNLYTVGDLYDFVIGSVAEPESKRCLTSMAFYRTRRGIIDALGIERRTVRPSTQLDTILPYDGRREKWCRVQAAMKLKVPDLRHSGWVVTALLSLGVAVALAPGIYAGVAAAWIAVLSLAGLAIGGFLIKLSPALAMEFPDREMTVGDLARDVLVANYGRILGETGGWKREEVWKTLCRVIVTQTGVDPEQVTPEARIVDDLGID